MNIKNFIARLYRSVNCKKFNSTTTRNKQLLVDGLQRTTFTKYGTRLIKLHLLSKYRYDQNRVIKV